MLLKFGVEISRLNRGIRNALLIIEAVFQEITKEEAVITSTYEGNHGVKSLHYANDAVDIRLPKPFFVEAATQALKKRLGKDYDVVLESTHIHIEYDPK